MRPSHQRFNIDQRRIYNLLGENLCLPETHELDGVALASSILQGFPIGLFTLNRENGICHVVDGAARIAALQSVFKGEIRYNLATEEFQKGASGLNLGLDRAGLFSFCSHLPEEEAELAERVYNTFRDYITPVAETNLTTEEREAFRLQMGRSYT